MNNFTSTILKKMIKGSNQRILVPFYHAVSDEVPSFIGGLYTPRKIQDFEKDLDVLLEFFEPISLQELMKIVTSDEPITKNYFHLTFDDGLANFYEIIAPILVKRNIPATVFLNTDFVDNKELFYRYKASLLLNYYLTSKKASKEVFHGVREVQGNSKESIENYLMSINFSDKSKLDDLAIKVGFSFNNFLKTEKPYLTKRQISELVGEGFTFGSHSMNHPYYKEISLQDQIKQTEISMDWMKQNLNILNKAFSFPFTDGGVSANFFSHIFSNKIVELSFGTAGLKIDQETYHIQRVNFEIENKELKPYLIKEYVKFYLKRLLGKHRVKRN